MFCHETIINFERGPRVQKKKKNVADHFSSTHKHRAIGNENPLSPRKLCANNTRFTPDDLFRFQARQSKRKHTTRWPCCSATSSVSRPSAVPPRRSWSSTCWSVCTTSSTRIAAIWTYTRWGFFVLNRGRWSSFFGRDGHETDGITTNTGFRIRTQHYTKREKMLFFFFFLFKHIEKNVIFV